MFIIYVAFFLIYIFVIYTFLCHLKVNYYHAHEKKHIWVTFYICHLMVTYYVLLGDTYVLLIKWCLLAILIAAIL